LSAFATAVTRLDSRWNVKSCISYCFSIGLPRRSRNLAPMFVAILLLMKIAVVRAELPSFPKGSISPLFGTWNNTQGPPSAALTIGRKWLVSSDGHCPVRSKYQVISTDKLTMKGETSLNVKLRLFAMRFLSGASPECSVQAFSQPFININLADQDQGSNAQIIVFSWDACDTSEHLSEYNDGLHESVDGCSPGGLMGRVPSNHRPHAPP
jgi:hypothetical protein